MIEDELLKNRIVFINGEIDDVTCYDIVTKLLYLDSVNNDDISLYINSPGGSVMSGLAIIDCMNTIKSKVATFSVGISYSMASIILASGAKGMRYTLPNSEIMIHAPSQTLSGKADIIAEGSKRLDEKKDLLINLLVKNTKLTKNKVVKYFGKDTFINSGEAIEYGIVDKIVKSS